MQRCLQNEDLLDSSCHRWVLGFLELSLSNPSAAMTHLEPALEYLDTLGAAEPGIILCIPDAVEALVALGRVDDAEPLVEKLQEQGLRLDRPWALTTAERCRGLVLAARGDLLGGLDALERALVEHRRLPQPFELGRTLLVLGELQRRARQRRAARETIHRALAIFDELGAPLWSQRARRELGRIGGRSAAGDELTPSERRIAELVAEGKTNKEVAAILVLAERTVESALTQMYRKLEVRSRTELAHKLRASD
jgi:DNA-binding CsgD family transcriptional regulator